jgi:hypothetical protein
MSERASIPTTHKEKNGAGNFIKEKIIDNRLLTNIGLLAIGLITAVQLIAITGAFLITPANIAVGAGAAVLALNDFRLNRKEQAEMKAKQLKMH